MSTNTTKIIRLEGRDVELLRATLPAPVPDSSTTEVKAGFMLGIQYVLNSLEKGVTVDDS